MKKICHIILWAGILLLPSCSLYHKYESGATVPDQVMGDIVDLQDTVSVGCLDWHDLFQDPLLQQLIEKALANNTNMRTAQLSIEQVKNEVKAARWGYAPTLALTPQATYQYQGGKNSLNVTLPVSASWQLGIFGQTRSQIRKAKAQQAYAEDFKQAVQVNLAALVADLYYTLAMLDRQLEIAEQTEILWTESLNTARSLYEAGIFQSPAVYQMEASLASIRTNIADLRYSSLLTEASLCQLLAEPPHRIERSPLTSFQVPEQIHVGLPIRLLAARPDVRMAEHNMEIAYYGTQMARQAFFPSISIDGLFGLGSVNPAMVLGQAVASLVQPVFAGGKLNAQLKNAKAEQEKAQLEFVQTLIDAGNEAYLYLHACRTAEEKSVHLDTRVNALQEAFQATSELMNHGSTTYLEVLTAQESLLAAQLEQVSNQYDLIVSMVDLYSALGGFGQE